jgi:hypothetical protein
MLNFDSNIEIRTPLTRYNSPASGGQFMLRINDEAR